MWGLVGLIQAGGLFGVEPQRVQKAAQIPLLPVDIPPVNAPGVHQGVKLRFGEAGPLLPDQGDGGVAVIGIVVLQPLQPVQLGIQAAAEGPVK